MSFELVAMIIASGLGSGVIVEVFKAWRSKSKDQLDLFYPTWKEEIIRMKLKVEELELIVLALSDEVERMGGNPMKIIASIRSKTKQ